MNRSNNCFSTALICPSLSFKPKRRPTVEKAAMPSPEQPKSPLRWAIYSSTLVAAGHPVSIYEDSSGAHREVTHLDTFEEPMEEEEEAIGVFERIDPGATMFQVGNRIPNNCPLHLWTIKLLKMIQTTIDLVVSNLNLIQSLYLN